MPKILIVEDEKKIARFLELELRHEGYDVLTAFDGRMTAYAPVIQYNPNPESESNTHISTELMRDCRTASAACNSFRVMTNF